MYKNRISKYCNDKRNPKRGQKGFLPDLQEWAKACEEYCYDKQIVKHFDICNETFYKFLDRQRYEEEHGRKAEFLEAYKNGKNKSRLEAIQLLKQSARKKDEAATIIFYAKTFGNLIESKDLKDLKMKKKEFALKQKEFLTKLAEKFELDFEQLKEFATKFFKDAKVDDI